VESVRWVKGGRTMEPRICGKDKFWAWSGREKEWWMVTVVTKEMMNWCEWDQMRVIGLTNNSTAADASDSSPFNSVQCQLETSSSVTVAPFRYVVGSSSCCSSMRSIIFNHSQLRCLHCRLSSSPDSFKSTILQRLHSPFSLTIMVLTCVSNWLSVFFRSTSSQTPEVCWS